MLEVFFMGGFLTEICLNIQITSEKQTIPPQPDGSGPLQKMSRYLGANIVKGEDDSRNSPWRSCESALPFGHALAVLCHLYLTARIGLKSERQKIFLI